MMRMIGLVDCNNFFVSCERSVNPDLNDKAVVVLSNNDGCAVARSNEAKRLGVRMGQPAFELRDHIRSGRLIALSGNHLLYRDISLKVHDIFRRYAPATIDYSIDEAFLDMSGIPSESLPSIGEAIWRACRDEVSIPVTVGFAASKTLAKLVTEDCKKRGERVGMVADPGDAEEILARLCIGELWGIGRRLSKRLYESGVYTILDFARKDVGWVRSKLGINGEKSWRELHGVDCIDLERVNRLLQDSVSESRTFPEDTADYDYLRARVAIYASDCAKKLRAMKGLCRQVTVLMRSNRFHTERGYYSPEGTVTLREPTSDTSLILEAALSVLDSIYMEGVAMKRAGVVLSLIEPDRPVTPSIFSTDEGPAPGSRKLMKAVDSINGEVGHGVLRLASQITNRHPGHNDGYSSSFGAPFDPTHKK